MSKPFKSRLVFLLISASVVLGTHLIYRYVTDGVAPPSQVNNPQGNSAPAVVRPAQSNAGAAGPQSVSHTSMTMPPQENSALYFGNKRVGSEGYAPIIRTTLESGSPADALRASALIQKCADILKDMDRLLRLRATSNELSYSQNYTRLIEENLAEQRACQTVDAEISGMRSALLLKAARGHELGAAAIFLSENRSAKEIPSEDRRDMIARLQADGDKGHRASIMMLGVGSSSDFGLSNEDQLIYRDALRLLVVQHPDIQIAANKPLQDLFGMLFEISSDAPIGDKQRHDQRVRALVEAHLKLRQAGEDS